MRRIMVVMVGACLLATLFTATAEAARPEKYQSKIFNAYWHSRKNISPLQFTRTSWRVEAYSTTDRFYSSAYRVTDLCTVGTTGTRCHFQEALYGSIRSLGTGTFTMDAKLGSATFAATYPMKDKTAAGTVRVDTSVSLNLFGVGNISRDKYRETYSDGCNTFRYSASSERRRATANGDYVIGDQAAERFGFTSDASISMGSALVFSKTC